MIRLKDIAAQAGVTVMTVSKALRDEPDISAATKLRIRALADKMGYVPYAAAAAMRGGATKLLGLVIPASTNPFFGRLQMAVEEQAHAHGYDLLLAHTLNQPDREAQVVRRLLARRVQGVLISPVYRMTQGVTVYDELLRLAIPTVILGHRAPFCAAFPNIESDDLLGAHAITRHLVQLGHRRIAYFAGPAVSPSAQERLEGHRRALREFHAAEDEKLVFNAGSTIEEGEKAATQLLNESPGATAIHAVNDLVAIGAATVLLNQGLRIPQDISIAGFGNILVAEHFRVPLTTVRQPKHRLGAGAMEMLLKLIRKEPVQSKRLPAEIVLRASTAPPPAK